MWGDTDWGQVSFKALQKLKGLGLGQQEHGGLHSLTWWGFWSMLPPRRSLSDCVSFSSVCLKSAGRKVTPSPSQQVRRSNGGWPAAIANGQTFVFVFVYTHKKNYNKGGCKAIDPVPGHLEKFWWRTPRIPGISRGFPKLCGLGFRDSRVTRRTNHDETITWNKRQRKRNAIRNMFWMQLEIVTAKKTVPLQPCQSTHHVPHPWNLST